LIAKFESPRVVPTVLNFELARAPPTLAAYGEGAKVPPRDYFFASGQFYDTVRTFWVKTLIFWAKDCPRDLADALQSIKLDSPVKLRDIA
jgi:hypothetical protein